MDSRMSGSPPPKGGPRTAIYRVTTSETQQFVVYSRSIFGQYIHWYGRRSHECSVDTKACDGCRRGWPRKWLGYLHVFNLHANEAQFLELTRTACELMLRLVPEDEPLRGLQVRFRKTKGGPKGRYICEVVETRIDEATLPEERDPITTLKYLWACKNSAGQPA